MKVLRKEEVATGVKHVTPDRAFALFYEGLVSCLKR